MSRKVFVIGVGMTKFEKPGSKDWDYPDTAIERLLLGGKRKSISGDRMSVFSQIRILPAGLGETRPPRESGPKI